MLDFLVLINTGPAKTDFNTYFWHRKQVSVVDLLYYFYIPSNPKT